MTVIQLKSTTVDDMGIKSYNDFDIDQVITEIEILKLSMYG